MRTLKFLFQSVIIGLAAAFMILVLRPVSKSNDDALTKPTATQTASALLSFAGAVESAAPAVVNIYTSKYVARRRDPLLNDPIFQHFFGQALRTPEQRRETSLCSGVIVTPDGYVLTNNHVIFSADEISIMLRDGRSIRAKLVGSDTEGDLAILKIELQDYTSILIGDSGAIRIGDLVFAISNPFGIG